ncbi:MAG: succinylglutamate desuccinylase/aspartoacylase family protein [Pseudomonadota bacterium]
MLELSASIPPAASPSFIQVDGPDDYIFASHDGVFEPMISLGERAVAGQVAGNIHDIETLSTEPIPQAFKKDGLVVCRRAMGRCARGDCLYHLASEIPTP